MNGNLTKETLELLGITKSARAQSDDIIKAFVQPGTATSGVQAYNLQAPSLKLYPVLTPFRNMIPRVGGGYSIQANWKAFTGINTAGTRASLQEGKRGGIISTTQNEYLAAFKGLGIEQSLTFEAGYSAEGYEDLKSLSAIQALQSLMIAEERIIIGGNASGIALGTTGTPTLALGSNGSGSLTNATTYSVICVALTLQAYLDVVGANNGAIGQTFVATAATVPGQITRTNADGTTTAINAGAGQKSANATLLTTGANQSILASVTAQAGAAGYAWFVGLAGAEKLAYVSSINSVIIYASPGSGQTAASLTAADYSQNSLDFDGLLAQALKSGSGAYNVQFATGTAGVGTPLTSDGAGGIAEFNTAFDYFWNMYRLSPTRIFVSSQEQNNISKKIIANGGVPLLREVISADAQGQLRSGFNVTTVMNRAMNIDVPITVHPNMTPGTILFYTDSLPYPLAGVGSVARILTRQDYYQIEWPVVTRQYNYGVYADEVLQHYAPFSMGVISNIANG